MSELNPTTSSSNQAVSKKSFQPLASNWCHSVSQLVKVNFEWTIDNILLQDELTSTPFFAEEYPDFKWKLKLETKEKTFSINVLLNEEKRLSKSVGLKMAVIDKMREKVFPIEKSVPKNASLPVCLFLVSRDAVLKKSDTLLINGNITIYCEVEIIMPKEPVAGKTALGLFTSSIDCKDDLIHNLEELFESMKLSDVIFDVDGQNFEGHMAILSARSQIFASMFDDPTNDCIGFKIKVRDCEPAVFKRILRYIYTGWVPFAEEGEDVSYETIAKLLAAAEKFLLENLKNECEKHLIDRMSTENCGQMFSLADYHSADYLKQCALDFLSRFPLKMDAEEEEGNQDEEDDGSRNWK